jgi:hypothetical protein
MSITITSANVRVGNDAVLRNYKSGAAVTVGYSVYLDSSGYVQHSDADASEVKSRGIGIVVASKDGETSVTSGDRCTVCLFGPVYGFSGMTPGEPVYVDTTAGLLTQTKPTSAYQHSIGYAESATCLFVNPDTEDPSSA